MEHQSLNWGIAKLWFSFTDLSFGAITKCNSRKDFQPTENINNSKKEPTVFGYTRKESFIEILQLFSKWRRNRKNNFWCDICLVLYQKSKKRLLKLCIHEINIKLSNHHQIHYYFIKVVSSTLIITLIRIKSLSHTLRIS